MFDVQLPALSHKQNYDQHKLMTATTQNNTKKMFYFWLQMYEQIFQNLHILASIYTHVNKIKINMYTHMHMYVHMCVCVCVCVCKTSNLM
jgi:hypothetical protein